jgi:GNAT superfamily N-acetyltransferase
MDIRPAQLADAARIAQLFVQLDYPVTAAEVARRLPRMLDDADSAVLLALDAGQVQGVLVLHTFQALHVARPWAVISALVVDQSVRSHGAGAALVAAAEQAAAERGCAHLELSCSERRIRAHGFYEAMGFGEVRKRFKKAIDHD